MKISLVNTLLQSRFNPEIQQFMLRMTEEGWVSHLRVGGYYHAQHTNASSKSGHRKKHGVLRRMPLFTILSH